MPTDMTKDEILKYKKHKNQLEDRLKCNIKKIARNIDVQSIFLRK